MTKKDYERAATIVQNTRHYEVQPGVTVRDELIDAFVAFFSGDNPRFDEARFRAACVPGANVKARPRKVRTDA